MAAAMRLVSTVKIAIYVHYAAKRGILANFVPANQPAK
jgi:hypothetical protein